MSQASLGYGATANIPHTETCLAGTWDLMSASWDTCPTRPAQAPGAS
jgi:hypothetical protein